jgi:hypothetical protein
MPLRLVFNFQHSPTVMKKSQAKAVAAWVVSAVWSVNVTVSIQLRMSKKVVLTEVFPISTNVWILNLEADQGEICFVTSCGGLQDRRLTYVSAKEDK